MDRVKTFLEAHHPLVKFEQKNNDAEWCRATKTVTSDMSEFNAMMYYVKFLDELVDRFPDTTLCLEDVQKEELDNGQTCYVFSFWFKP